MSIGDVFGLSGAAIILLAYGLMLKGVLDENGKRYPLMNLLGSLCLLASLNWQPNTASLIINLFWAGVSIYGLMKHRNTTASQE